MTNIATTCTGCARPVADGAYVCATCTEQTGKNLDFIIEMGTHLEVTLTRQDRVSSGSGGRASAETPLPLNLHASDVGQRLRTALTTWARVLIDERGMTADEAFPQTVTRPPGPVCGGDGSWCLHTSCRAILLAPRREATNAEIARFLRGHLSWAAHRDWAPQAFDELSRCAIDLGRAVDSPPPMISLGRCEAENCTGELRAHKEAAWTKCRECGEPYDVRKLKDTLLSRAGHIQRNAASIARILTALQDRNAEGKLIVRELQWVTNRVQRKQLFPVGTDDAGQRTYRLGDARRLHDEAIAKDLQAAERKAARLESQAA